MEVYLNWNFQGSKIISLNNELKSLKIEKQNLRRGFYPLPPTILTFMKTANVKIGFLVYFP